MARDEVESYLIKKDRCPACANRGRDQRGDNLGVYSDGHAFCFSCGFITKGHFKNSNTDPIQLHGETSKGKDTLSFQPVAKWTNKIPEAVKEQLYNQGLTPRDLFLYKILFDKESSAVIFPVYDKESTLVFVSKRIYGLDYGHNPKYISAGRKPYIPFGDTSDKSCVVLVEDFISAVVVAREVPTVPLFGVSIPKKEVFRLASEFKRMVVWLDPDKRIEALRMARKWQHMFDNGTTAVLTHSKDPKRHSKEELINIINKHI